MCVCFLLFRLEGYLICLLCLTVWWILTINMCVSFCWRRVHWVLATDPARRLDRLYSVHSAVQLKLPDITTADIIYVFMSILLEILLNSFLELERWWDSTGGLRRHHLADIISPWVYTFAKVEKPKQATQQILQQTQRISEHETWTNLRSRSWCQNSFVSSHPFFDKIRPTWF